MSFGQSQFLIALVLLPVMGLFSWWAWRRQGELLGRLGDPSLVARLSEVVNWHGRKQRNLLWLIALGLVIIALTRPQWGSEVQIVEQEGVQVMVVLDISQSMLAEDLRPSRLTQAKLVVTELFDRLPGNEIGMVLFSGASFIQFPLTTDTNSARSFLEFVGPGLISRPGTRLGGAIDTAVGGFDPERSSQKVIIILTDGENHEDDGVAAARAAAESNIIIYTIGLGSPDGAPIPEFNVDGQRVGYKKDDQGEVILSRLDETTLLEIASVGDGRYLRATPNGSELEALVDDLSTMQKGELGSQLQTNPIERFQIFLLTAVLLLLWVELIPDRVKQL